MKYYSEVLDKMFDDDKALIKAEDEHQKAIEEKKAHDQKLADERKARAKEVEDALKEAQAAEKKYWELRNKFVKDYGAWHISYKDTSDGITTIFNELFKIF